MTNEVKTLTDKQIKELIDADINAKKAIGKLKELKQKYCKDITVGKHDSKYGYVLKTIFTRKDLDKDKLFNEHPEIDEDVYLTEKEVTSITIQNMR